MTVLVLVHRDRVLREYTAQDGMLIGCSRYCDVVVQDPGVRARAFRVEVSQGGEVQLRDMSEPLRVLSLGAGEQVPLGSEHVIRCMSEGLARGTCTKPIRTESLDGSFALHVPLDGRDRRFRLSDRPLIVGADPLCDVRLDDRTVSGRHCALEAGNGVVLVRDLGSRNGTWVDGRRVLGAVEHHGGFELRVGRTRLHVAPRGTQDADFIVKSALMVDVMRDVRRFAALPYPTLVLGESGVGKEGVARALHAQGPRAAGPFVALNAASLTPTLLESELFGHQQGAFTGATRQRRGAFQMAAGGTLFLDEIGELPLLLQTRLLRVLETWRVRPLGSDKELPVDVRVVAATNRDPAEMVERGLFRRDLFHRLGRLIVRVPPLRQRQEDILPLAHFFLEEFAAHGGTRRLERCAIDFLRRHPFHGNVRELRNLIQSAAARTEESIDGETLQRAGGQQMVSEPPAEVLRTVLARYGGNKAAAARALGMARSTLRDRLRRAEEQDALADTEVRLKRAV